MAEARSAVAELRIHDLEEGKAGVWGDIVREWRKAVVRHYFRTRNTIRNGLWPTSLWNLGAAVIIFYCLLFGDFDIMKPVTKGLWPIGEAMRLPNGTPRWLRVLLISCVLGFIFFFLLMQVRRQVLTVLLHYRGWMYMTPKQMTWSVLLWGFVTKLFSGYSPSLYSCQRSLPRLPVPALSQTMHKLLLSLKPLLTAKEYEQMKQDAQDFERGVGPKLQRILTLKSWWAQNWVSDWWEKYVYLMGRSPLPNNSNYYCVEYSYYSPTQLQASRAAILTHYAMQYKTLIDRELLQPLCIRGTVPICMAQYERMFSTTRVPGEDVDTITHYESKHSRHLVVSCKGVFYKLDVYDVNGKLLLPQYLEQQYEWIIQDAEKHKDTYTDAERSLAALTTMERTAWAETRKKYFRSGVNREAMDIVEKAVNFVCLSDEEPQHFNDKANFLLHGDGRSVWFDKSISMVFFKNGGFGVNCEHSFGDAPIIAHLIEWVMLAEIIHMTHQGSYDEHGRCRVFTDYRQGALKQPTRLVWDVPEPLSTRVLSALKEASTCNADMELVVRDFNFYGKGFIKTCKVSPDAWIQMALQLTFYKEAGHFVLTYEASMTRLYLAGRTETVRTLTCEAAEFVRAMVDDNVAVATKVALLRRAAAVHQRLYKDSMNGMGIDRHLFGLYVVAKGLGYDSSFLGKVLSRPWTMSTSQQPQTQITTSPDPNLPFFKDKMCPGGGFGPVADDGYGVSYMVPNDAKIFFHVSSRRSCVNTDSARFQDRLFATLSDMKALFEEPQ